MMIKGKKVAIGPLLPEDSNAMFRWFNDVDAARLDLAYRPTDWTAFKAWAENISKDTTRVLFAIRKLEEQPIIGFVGLSGINPVHRSADVAVRIGDDVNRNKGFGEDALRLALEFGWKHLNLHRIALSCLAHNERAIRAFLAVGFQREGIARSAAFIDGQWHDIAIMGALRPIPD